MDEFEKLQKLIRLKAYETPGEKFVDDFVATFRERQRAEMLKQSARGLLWERFQAYWDQMFSPRWALAAAVVLIGLLCGWLLIPHTPSNSNAGVADRGAAQAPLSVTLGNDPSGKVIPAFTLESIRIMGDVEPQPDPGLLSRHFTGGFDEFVLVPHEDSESTIAVPFEFLPLDGKADAR